MTYQEVLENARTCVGPHCKACPVCNGLVCKNTVPGPGAKGIGTGFIRNYQKWQELCVNMITYGSYLDKKENLVKNSGIVVIADTSVAIMAGIAVIPSAVAYGIQQGIPVGEIALGGPSLLFVTLQNVFNSMGSVGALFGIIFYLLVLIAAISSAISLIEVIATFFMLDNKIQALAELLTHTNQVTVLTGAGMSTESGIPDFRSANGLWTKDMSLAEAVSIDYFLQDPPAFWRTFKSIFAIKIAGKYLPNEGHQFLAWLESIGKKVTILTQNIDGLHQRAGSSEVIELHGSLMSASCPSCGTAHGARRLTLATMGLIQYISPTLQLLLGVLLYHEAFDQARLIGFAFIWSGLVIYTLTSLRTLLRSRFAAR